MACVQTVDNPRAEHAGRHIRATGKTAPRKLRMETGMILRLS